jgi:hypothetical protein
MTDMTRRDRDDLQKVVRLRTKLAKDGVAVREAELLAIVEDELSMSFRFDQDVIADITRQANEAITAADAALAQRCRELGVREEFRPKLALSWYGRGANAIGERRTELRKLAQTRIAAAGKAAKGTIDARSSQIVTDLIVGGLESTEARAYIETIPTAGELMPTFDVAALETEAKAAVDRQGIGHHLALLPRAHE